MSDDRFGTVAPALIPEAKCARHVWSGRTASPAGDWQACERCGCTKWIYLGGNAAWPRVRYEWPDGAWTVRAGACAPGGAP